MQVKPEILIVGGGVIGLSIGWELQRAGRQVVVFDRAEAGRQASWQAGGMLAPAAEIGFEEPDLYEFSRESTDLWPQFVQRLESESGMEVGFRREGTLAVADDADSADRLRRVYDFQVEQNLNVEWLSGHEARDLEPFLAPRVTAAVYSPDDVQVDNQLLVLALVEAIRRSGGEVREHSPVVSIEPDSRTPRVVLDDGSEIKGETVILAADAMREGFLHLSGPGSPEVLLGGSVGAIRVSQRRTPPLRVNSIIEV